MREIFTLPTGRREQLLDITEQLQEVVKRSGMQNGVAALYAQGATAALIILESSVDRFEL